MSAADIVFLLDVDDTLLDNDRFGVDLGNRLEQAFGAAERERYFRIFEGLRSERGVADYLGALQALRAGLDDHPELLRMSEFLLEYPFAERLYPNALAAVAHLGRLGRPAVLSDGDIVFQPRKIQRSGIWDAVGGRVMITIHKERVLDEVEKRFPARRYVMIDDKVRLLAAIKPVLGDRVTTVFVRQGHYALAPDAGSVRPAPDMTIERIGDSINWDKSAFKEPT
ncbi:MAG TPA: HAD family hydrolase [Steroidobacteraceae bacterium]|nr:HAD family hydrolase [Steroidobacteraceae bacterium]